MTWNVQYDISGTVCRLGWSSEKPKRKPRRVRCWSCGDLVERQETVPVLGVARGRCCYTCDDETIRTPARIAGPVIRQYELELTP